MTYRAPGPLGCRSFAAPLALAAWTLAARPALALQPVTEFLEHARTWNPQNRAAHATTSQRDAEVAISTGNLLPNFSATGTYTRNQYEVDDGRAPRRSESARRHHPSEHVIQPQNQLDANVILNVPLINIANWDRRAGAEGDARGRAGRRGERELTVEKSVLRDYYTLLGDEAVLLSATQEPGDRRSTT